MIHSTQRDQDRSFCCQVNSNIMLNNFLYEMRLFKSLRPLRSLRLLRSLRQLRFVMAWKITQQAAFDFLRPKRLLRSLRPVILSCLLRSWRPLGLSIPLKSLKLISQNHLILMLLNKNISEWNDGISSEILPSFRTEAVEDRDVIFNQIQGS